MPRWAWLLGAGWCIVSMLAGLGWSIWASQQKRRRTGARETWIKGQR